MRTAAPQGVSRPKQFITTTRRDEAATSAPDLAQRQFRATARNQRWGADITYIATGSGFVYLAVVLDAWSRRVVGWAMAPHLRTELVMDALDQSRPKKSQLSQEVVLNRRFSPDVAP